MQTDGLSALYSRKKIYLYTYINSCVHINNLHCLLFSIKQTQWTALVTGRYMITMMMLLCYVNLSGMSLECIVIVIINNLLLGGQCCTDSVDIQQSGLFIFRDSLAIIPRLNFTCDGRITSIRARVSLSATRNDYPFFQVWRPSSAGSTVYNKIGEAQLQSDDQVIIGSNKFHETNITLTGNSTIEFQSGDVVGYYQPPQSRYQVVNTQRFGNGYVLYWFDGSPATNSIDLSERNFIRDSYQPLLQFSIGMD